ncbi:MAG: VOC family protein [bacterium]|nr:VOC family protein [bacterium]
MSPKSHIPEGFHTINPYMHAADAASLLKFLQDVFDAQVIMNMPGDEGEVRHAEVRIGDSALELSDACDDWPAMQASIHIYVPDVDAVFAKAEEAGCESLSDVADQFYGERSATVRDPWGNLWHIATNTEDVSVEEMEKRVAEYERDISGEQ